MLLVILLGFLPMAKAMKAQFDVLLDTSASMNGFREKNDWCTLLQKFESHINKKYRFGDADKFKNVGNTPLCQVSLNNNFTYLGEAVKLWTNMASQGSTLLIITDNVADTGNPASNKSQKLLNNMITGPNKVFSHVAVTTLRLNFDGLVYDLANNRHRYDGKRALVIYILKYKGSNTADFNEVRDFVTTNLKPYESRLFQIAPFDSQQVESKIDNLDLVRPFDGSTNVVLREDGTIQVHKHRLGNPLFFTFSTFIHTDQSFEFRNINVAARIEFDRLPKHLTNKRLSDQSTVIGAEVTPTVTDLYPNKPKEFNISFNIGSFGFADIPLIEKIRYTLQDTQQYDGRLFIEFTANRDKIHIPKEILEDWAYRGSADNLSEPQIQIQSKVYNLDSLIRETISTEQMVKNLKTIPIELELHYPLRYAFAMVLLVVLFIGFLCFLYVLLVKSKKYILEDDLDEKNEFSSGLNGRYKHYDREGNLLFTLRNIGIGFWLSGQNIKPGLINAGQRISVYNDESAEHFTGRIIKVGFNRPGYQNVDEYDV